MLRTFWSAIIASIFICNSVAAAPSISNVSGVISKGGSVTIEGSAFGTKPHVAPLKWDDFESGTNGNSVTGWTGLRGTNDPIYSNENNRIGSSLNSQHLLGPGDSIDRNSYMYYTKSSDFDKLFVSFWVRFNWGSGDEDYQIKLWRIRNGTLDRPSLANFNWSRGSHYFQLTYTAGADTWGISPRYTENIWFLYEVQLKSSDVGTANGSFEVWNSRPSGAIAKVISDTSMMTRKGPDGFDTIKFGEYIGNGGIQTLIYFDDIYIDDSWARVVIGDNASYANCTYREIQIPTTWSNTSVSATVNKGSFQEGRTAYLFVVDAEGNVNTNGYPVVIGGGGGEDSTAPTVSGHNPSKNATDVARNTNIIVHVQDSGDGVDESSIVMTVEGSPVSPTIAGTAADYTLTYDPPSDFSPGQVVDVTIDAQDLHSPANVMATDTYSFTTGSAPDITNPTIAITSPTSTSTYSTDQSTITLSGTASDDVGVTSVTWQNDRGGNSTASGTTSWTISNVSLEEGDNVITVTAHDAAENTSADTLTVTCTYTPPTGTYTEEFGSATGADYPGTLQDTFININEENSSTHVYLNTYTWPQDTVANAIIMNWDLSAIPSSATIQDATLYLYLSSAEGDDLYDLTVHKIIHYNPVISACTGYTYDGTNSWTPNNQCYNDIPLAQADIATAEDTKSIDKTYGYKSWNVTNMVQDWVSNQGSNYGMLVNSDTVASSDSNRLFSATESSNPDQRPKLVVTYSVGEDVTPPTVTITQPIFEDIYITDKDIITLSGTASDNVGVTSVTWTNSQGGNGTASGTTDWTIAIPLHCGDDNNVITITAKDAANNAASATLTIDVSPCPVSGFGL